LIDACAGKARWITRFGLLGLGLALAAIAACSGGSSGKQAAFGCSVDAQKQAVAELIREWYFFNDEPDQQQKYVALDLAGFADAEELLAFLRYRPEEFDRDFSFLTTAAADQQFFGEGQFVGFGFGSKFADPPMNADLRLTQVFAGSPAAAAGLARGFRMLAVDGRSIAEINQAEGLSAALGPDSVGVTRTLSVRDLDAVELDVTLAKAVVTIDPVPLTAIFDAGGERVAYLDLRTFVSTADAELEQAFAEFEAASATALVVDLRYNGGGLVATAGRLNDLIGGFVAAGEVQSETRFNSAKSLLNAVTRFTQRANSLSLLQQVVFITTGSSASASELVINGLRPHTVVALVGSATFGKPVGQSALGYCGGQRLLRAVTFETVNALGEGGFYDGLPTDCAAADELERAVGDPLEASLAGALHFVEHGACPAAAALAKPGAPAFALQDPPLGPSASAARRYAGAF
jgi:hypothetical protein